MAYNKITLNGETKIDLTQDTVTAEDVALGKTFHLNSGEIATGTLEISSGGGEFFDRTFANNSPDQISKVSAIISYNNMTSAEVETNFGWKLGDTISYKLSTGENIAMRIIGFNHDTKSDGSGKAGITLDMTGRIAFSTINNENTNAGGYPASVLRNTKLPTIKATLPQEWQDVIKHVDKQSANGSSSNYTEVLTTSEDLFLLSEMELQGYKRLSQINEGTQYEYWKNHNTNEARKSKGYAWLRSCYYEAPSYFCRLEDGAISAVGALNSCGTSYAFCI